MSEFNASLHKRLQLCPHCQQPLPIVRLGVRLSPLKGRILDAIILKGGDGIVVDDLLSRFSMSRNTLKVHVHQVNEKLVEVGYRIYGRGGRYRLVRTGKKIIAEAARIMEPS